MARKVNIVALFACHFLSVWRAFRKVATATAVGKIKNKIANHMMKETVLFLTKNFAKL